MPPTPLFRLLLAAVPYAAAASAAAAAAAVPVFPGVGCGTTTSYKVIEEVPDDVAVQDLNCTIVKSKVCTCVLDNKYRFLSVD